MKWLTIFGLIFQFFAFWFAAPELLGSDTLKRFEKGLISFIGKVPTLLIASAAVIIGILMSVFGIQQGIKAAESDSTNVIYLMVFILLISAVLMIYFLFYAKKTQQWMSTKMAQPLMQKLISSNKSRKTALIAGAILFTLGFIFQLIAACFS